VNKVIDQTDDKFLKYRDLIDSKLLNTWTKLTIWWGQRPFWDINKSQALIWEYITKSLTKLIVYSFKIIESKI
jgi:hypothetical protein